MAEKPNHKPLRRIERLFLIKCTSGEKNRQCFIFREPHERIHVESQSELKILQSQGALYYDDDHLLDDSRGCF